MSRAIMSIACKNLQSHLHCGLNGAARSNWNEAIKSLVEQSLQVVFHKRLAVHNDFSKGLEQQINIRERWKKNV